MALKSCARISREGPVHGLQYEAGRHRRDRCGWVGEGDRVLDLRIGSLAQASAQAIRAIDNTTAATGRFLLLLGDHLRATPPPGSSAPAPLGNSTPDHRGAPDADRASVSTHLDPAERAVPALPCALASSSSQPDLEEFSGVQSGQFISAVPPKAPRAPNRAAPTRPAWGYFPAARRRTGWPATRWPQRTTA